jgi:hypothetical protein
VEKVKQRDEVTGQVRVSVLNPKRNGVGRRALGREGSIGEEKMGKASRIVVGVDDGERAENGRSTLQGLGSLKKGTVSCVRSSHAPTRGEGRVEEVERRLPRKTSVESDHRRVNRGGKAEWTTGIGTTPRRRTPKQGKVQGSEKKTYDWFNFRRKKKMGYGRVVRSSRK